MKYKITNNFNTEIVCTSSTGQDLKDEVRFMARKAGKKISDYKIEKIRI